MDRRLVILGGPGDGAVVAEALLQSRAAGSRDALLGFLDDGMTRDESIYGFPVLGGLDDWRRLEDGVGLVWALHRVGMMEDRVRRFESLGIPEHRFVSVRHPQSCVASTAEIGIGSFIASFVTIQPMSRIGAFATLRAGANVGHHAQVGDHAYVGPNATLCGYSRLETGAALAPNAVLLEHTTVGSFAVAGIGAAVTKDVPARTVVLGSPARHVPVVRRPIVRSPSGGPPAAHGPEPRKE